MKNFFKVLIGDKKVFFLADDEKQIRYFYQGYPLINIKKIEKITPSGLFDATVVQNFVYINETETELQLKPGTAIKTTDGKIKITIQLKAK